MRIGTLITVPNDYSRYGRVLDENGVAYTVDPGEIPAGASEGATVAYRVEIWGNDSGLAHSLEEQ